MLIKKLRYQKAANNTAKKVLSEKDLIAMLVKHLLYIQKKLPKTTLKNRFQKQTKSKCSPRKYRKKALSNKCNRKTTVLRIFWKYSGTKMLPKILPKNFNWKKPCKNAAKKTAEESLSRKHCIEMFNNFLQYITADQNTAKNNSQEKNVPNCSWKNSCNYAVQSTLKKLTFWRKEN